jgi:hypothetical protein
MKYTINDIKEAIEHCEEVIKNSCSNNKCKRDHLVLKTMLEDLLKIKKDKKGKEND